MLVPLPTSRELNRFLPPPRLLWQPERCPPSPKELFRNGLHQRHKDPLASRDPLPALEVQQTTKQVLSSSLPTLLLVPHASSGPELKPQHVAGLILAWVQTQGKIFPQMLAFSRTAPARVFRDSSSFAIIPQAALFFFAKRNCIRRTRTVCVSGTRAYAAA